MKRFFKVIILALIAVLLVVAAVGCAPTGDEGKKGLQIAKYGDDSYYTVYGYVGSQDVDSLDLAEEAEKLSLEKGEEVKIGRIKANAFNGNDTLKEIIVPQTVEVMDGGAFAGMKKLEKLTIPFVGKCFKSDTFYAETEKQDKAVDEERTFGYLFGTESYEFGTAIVQNYDAENSITTYIPLSLKEVTIASKAGYKVPMYAFNGNNRIRKVVLDENVTVIGQNAFEGCAMLSEITIPKEVLIIRDYAFSGCQNLNAGFKFQDGAKLTTILEGAFAGVGISELTLPESVNFVGSRCFKESKISAITFPSSISMIPDYAFWGCAELVSVNGKTTISAIEGEFTIGLNAFYGCVELN